MAKAAWIREAQFMDKILAQPGMFKLDLIKTIAKATGVSIMTGLTILQSLKETGLVISFVTGAMMINDRFWHKT